MLQELIHTLAASTSSQADVRIQAEEQLKAWAASTPDFYLGLLSVIEVGEVDVVVKIQASLVFKNALDRWRKTSPK